MKQQHGLALVLVLWVLSLLTIMAGSFSLSMRREAAIASGVKQNVQALALAEAGIALAEMMLLLPENKAWRTDGSIYQLTSDNAQVRIQLVSEAGKIDINRADEKLLRTVFAHAPVSEEQNKNLDIVSVILDWRDEDDLIHLNGAEKKQYLAEGLSYSPRNKPFQSLEELQLVLGMNEELYQWLEPLVTLYSGQSKPNLRLASRDILTLMPELDADLLQKYLQVRRETAQQGLPAPAFPSAGQIVVPPPNEGQDPSTVPESTEEQDTVNGEAVGSTEAVEISAVTIIAEAVLADGTSTAIKAIVKTSDGSTDSPFIIIDWQNNLPLTTSLFADSMNDLLITNYDEPEFNH